MSCHARGTNQMRIEISIENENEDCFEHEGYYDTIDEAIQNLYRLKIDEVVSKASRCHKCVYELNCSSSDKDGNCPDYKRDPPDGGYYG